MTTHTHATPFRSNRLQSGTNFLGIIVAAAGWFGGALWDPGQSPGAKTFYAIGQHTVVFFIKSSVHIVYKSIQERRGSQILTAEMIKICNFAQSRVRIDVIFDQYVGNIFVGLSPL